jgi:hypothetical protein
LIKVIASEIFIDIAYLNVVNIMIKLSSLFYMLLSSSIASMGLLCFPSSLAASGDIYGAEVRYTNCSQIQKRMNMANYPNAIFRGFEKANLKRYTYADFQYLVYCNGGTITDREDNTICRAYIGYMYSPKLGIAQYVDRWGRTDGSPNFNDNNKDDYCRRIK